MSMELTCPGCGASILAEEEEMGTVISCPGCESELTVPTADGSTPDGALSAGRTRPDQIAVSSADAPAGSQTIRPIAFNIGTRGGMAAEFDNLKSTLGHKLSEMKRLGQISKSAGLGQTLGMASASLDGDLGVGLQHSSATFRSDDLEVAFQIAIFQLQLRASYLGANAVYGFRWDLDFDSHSNVINFLGTAYGTAVTV